MRLGLVCLGLLTAFAAHGQRNKNDDTEATKRACSVEDCFFERDVREFEVIDQTHVIVYAGSQRCAFHVELRGTMCDLSFAPELYFSRLGEIPDTFGGDDTAVRTDPFGPAALGRDRKDLRICTNDLSVQVTGGRFTESVSSNPTVDRSGTTRTSTSTDRFGNPRTDCRVSTVTSITDDQLLEFYVARKVVPPVPPMGTGEIEVGEQEEDEE